MKICEDYDDFLLQWQQRALNHCSLYYEQKENKKKELYNFKEFWNFNARIICGIFQIFPHLEKPLGNPKAFPLVQVHDSTPLWPVVVTDDPRRPLCSISTCCQHPGSITKAERPASTRRPRSRWRIFCFILHSDPGMVRIWVKMWSLIVLLNRKQFGVLTRGKRGDLNVLPSLLNRQRLLRTML